MIKIESKLFAIIDNYNKFDVEIDLKSSIDETIGIDSFSFINMVFDIEHEFNINFTINELTQCLNVDSLLQVITSKINKNTSS